MVTGRATLGATVIDFHPQTACRTDPSREYDEFHVHVSFQGQEFFYQGNTLVTNNDPRLCAQMEVEVNTFYHNMRSYKTGGIPDTLELALKEAGILKPRDEVVQGLRSLAKDHPKYALPEHRETYTGARL